MTELTEGERAELEALRRSEARYRRLAEKARDLIVEYDARGVIVFASSAAAAFGYRPEDLVGRNIAEFGHPEDQAYLATRMDDLNAGGAMRGGEDNEQRIRRGDGGWTWIQGNPTPILDAQGRFTGAVTILRDVAERRQLEDELRRRRDEAEAAALEKGEFLANVSHELRTPLTAIVGFASLLGRTEGLPARVRGQIDRIRVAGDALNVILNNVLDFSKIEAGELELRPCPCDVRQVVEGVLDAVRPDAAAKDLRLSARFEGLEAAPLLLDHARFEQLVMNLVANAVKFTLRGEVHVEARYVEPHRRLVVAVRDTGVGIDPARLPYLFRRFTQLESSNARRFAGVGLGLAISKGLVERMEGEIGVESRVGEGSTFWVSLPVSAAVGPTDRAAADRAAPGRPARILVVDDVPINRELLRALLDGIDCEIVEADDGQAAVRASAQDAFDLVLMDIQMPNMDGISATRLIRLGDGPNRATPIIAVSASVQPAEVEACRRAGMNDHVPKPIRPFDLRTKVERWLSPDPDAATWGAAGATLGGSGPALSPRT